MDLSWVKLVRTEDLTLSDDIKMFKQNSIPSLVARLERIYRKEIASVTVNTVKRSKEEMECLLTKLLEDYFLCVESLKLSRALKKLIFIWKDEYQGYIEDKMMTFVMSEISKENIENLSLNIVSNVLEDNMILSKFSLDDKRHLLCWLITNIKQRICQSQHQSSFNSDIYFYIKISLIFVQQSKFTVFGDNVCSEYWEMFILLYTILNSSGFTTECFLLTGTALSSMLISKEYISSSLSCIRTVIERLCSGSGVQIQELKEKAIASEADIKNQRTIECMNPHGRLGILCLINGIISIGQVSFLAFSSMPLLLDLFPLVKDFCERGISHHYQAFLVLNMWLKKLKTCLVDLELEYSQENLQGILSFCINIVFLNCDSPVKDVPGLVGEVFKWTLDCSQEHCKMYPEDDLSVGILERVLSMGWNIKGRYRILAELIPSLSSFLIEDFLETVELKKDLSKSLSMNDLASVCGDIYTALILRKNDVTMWKKIWLNTIIQGMISKNSVQRSNVCHYMVLPTVKNMPSAAKELQDYLQISMKQVTENKKMFLHAWINVYKLRRQMISIQLEHEDLVKQALYSSGDDIRGQAIALLCTTFRRAEPLNQMEVNLLKEGLEGNLRVDNAPFCQQLMSSVKRLFARIRDSCISCLKNKKTNVLDISLEFVDWFHNVCIKNVLPGQTYQQRKTALEILCLLYETLLAHSQGKSSRLKPNDLLTYAKSQDKWQFSTTNNLMCLLNCLTDNTEEIQQMACGLVSQFFTFPLQPSVDISSKTFVCMLLTDAIQMCNSPKASRSKGGATLFEMIFIRYICDLGWLLSVDYSQNPPIINVDDSRGSNACQQFLMSLLDFLKSSIQICSQNIVSASRDQPLHGLVDACTRCVIKSPNETLPAQSVKSLYSSLLDVNISLINLALQVMAGGKEDESCPSFADIGLALENLISENVSTYEEMTSLSSDHHFLLSWCWLNIKESCQSLAELVKWKVQEERSDDEDQVERVGDMLTKVLTQCRHRGVIEGCRDSFNLFCSTLLSCSKYSHIPIDIFKKSFLLLEKQATKTSVTRKSAGLPIIVQTILLSGQMKTKVFLQNCIENLMAMVQQPLPDCFSEKHDLPQVHGLNILKSLFSCSALADSMVPYVSTAIMVVIDNFASPAWVIRNAATRLLSTLMRRMFGKQKDASEESLHSLTWLQLANMYPSLPGFINQHLDTALKQDVSTFDLTHPPLFPVLTIFSNLSQPNEIDEGHLDMKKKLETFKSSPIFHLRNLAAKACVAMESCNSTEQNVSDVVDMLPSVKNLNQLHGQLLFLQHLIPSNGCTFHTVAIVAKLVSILEKSSFIKNNHLVAQTVFCVIWKLSVGQLITEMKTHLRLIIIRYHIINLPEVKSKLTLLFDNEHLLLELFNYSLRQTDLNVQQDFLEAFIHCLKSRQTVSYVDDMNLSFILCQTILLLGNSSYPPILCHCVEILLSLPKHLVSASCMDILYCFQDLQEKQPFSALSGMKLRLGAVCWKTMLKNKRLDSSLLESWSESLLSCSNVVGEENIRMSAALALSSCGQEMLTCPLLSDEVVSKILVSCIYLIQDDDVDVRAICEDFLSSFFKSLNLTQVEFLQYNMCHKMLLKYIVEFHWSQARVMNALIAQIYTEGQLQQMIELKLKSGTLFEQDDNNRFHESTLSVFTTYASLKSSLKKISTVPGVLLASSDFHSKLEEDLAFVNDFSRNELKVINSMLSEASTFRAICGAVLVYRLCSQLELFTGKHFLEVENFASELLERFAAFS